MDSSAWSEPQYHETVEWVRSRYRFHLGRDLDLSGFGAYVGHLREGRLTREQADETWAWGELPPDKPICDGWDALPDGTWPMVGIQHGSQRDAVVAEARAKHRNTLAILAAHPGGSNGAEIPPDPARLAATDAFVRAQGFHPFHWLWSAEAEQRWGEGKRYVWDCSAALSTDTDITVIESDEYWDDIELGHVIRDLPRPQRFWCHYIPRIVEPAPSAAHGLLLQLEPPDDLRTWLRWARGVWGARPVVLAEIQGDPPVARWQKFQEWLRLGGAGGTHVGVRR